VLSLSIHKSLTSVLGSLPSVALPSE